jgi:hypothetical protein
VAGAVAVFVATVFPFTRSAYSFPLRVRATWDQRFEGTADGPVSKGQIPPPSPDIAKPRPLPGARYSRS